MAEEINREMMRCMTAYNGIAPSEDSKGMAFEKKATKTRICHKN